MNMPLDDFTINLVVAVVTMGIAFVLVGGRDNTK